MKQNAEIAHARKLRQTRQTRADHALRFRAQCGALGLSAIEAAKLLHVTPRTVHNWFSGRVRPPYVAVKLLRLMHHMELPGWDGWTFHSGQLWTPEGFSFKPTDGSWWSLLVRQARGFTAVYRDLQALRSAAIRELPAGRVLPSAAGAGLVTSINNVNTALDTGVISYQFDNGLISWPRIPLDSPTTSTSKPETGQQLSASASMPSSALPLKPISEAPERLHHLLNRPSSPMRNSSSLCKPLTDLVSSDRRQHGPRLIPSPNWAPAPPNASGRRLPNGMNGTRSDAPEASRIPLDLAAQGSTTRTFEGKPS